MANDPAAPAAGTDEYSDAFAEFAGGEPTEQPKTPDPAPPTDTPESAPAPVEEPPAATEPPQRVTKTGFTPLAEDDPIWANAPEEARNAYRDVVQRFRSEDGRIRSYQQRVTENEKQIGNLVAQLRTLEQRANGNQPQPTGPVTDAEWEQFKQDYPEIAPAIEKRLGSILGENEQLKQRLQQIDGNVQGLGQNLYERQILANEDALAEAVPDWSDIPDDPRWMEWLQEQPKFVREVVGRNAKQIVDPQEAAYVFQLFKSDVAADEPAASASPPAATPAQPPNPQSARRARQLDASRTVSGARGPAPATGAPDSYDAAWDNFAKQAERKLQAAH